MSSMRRFTFVAASLVAAALVVASCSFLVGFDPDGLPCDDLGRCWAEGGYHCVVVADAGVCRRSDGGVAAGADAGLDGGLRDGGSSDGGKLDGGLSADGGPRDGGDGG
jgi:hypothetical protein